MQTLIQLTNSEKIHLTNISQDIIDAYYPASSAMFNHASELASKHRESVFFRTDVDGEALYEAYLSSFPTPEVRQYHTCNCCRHFFKKYGGLVYVDTQTWETESAIFPTDVSNLHPAFEHAFKTMREMVLKAKIQGVFYSDEATYGSSHSGGWEHFYVPGIAGHGKNRVNTARQNISEVLEDHRLMNEGLNRWPVALYETAHRYFTMDETLQHAKHHIENLVWAQQLLEYRRQTQEHRLIHNRFWYEAATQPKARTRIAITVMGEYLQTLSTGNAALAKANFISNTDPKDYMRPKAAPHSATVARAEEIVEKLGVKDSLRRRALRRDELKAVKWRPAPPVPPKFGGVFDNVKTKNQSKPLIADSVIGGTITVGKFLNKILPEAEKIFFRIPTQSSEQYFSMTTAAVEDSPSIFHYGGKEASYHYRGGSHARNWGLIQGESVEVIAVIGETAEKPDSQRFNFVLASGYDKNNPPAAIFPEMLSREFHEVRSVIESFSNSAKLEEPQEGFVAWNPFGAMPTDVWVHTNGGKTSVQYRIVNLE